MQKILEIAWELENLGNTLEDRHFVAILNLPGTNLCEKRDELVIRGSRVEQACRGCITQRIRLEERISKTAIKGIIDFFKENYDTRFITVNGRGDPFHPQLREETLFKVQYAASNGIKAYIFTAGNNLDDEVCKVLAESGVNVTMSLFGNQFIDKCLFEPTYEYKIRPFGISPAKGKKEQDQMQIASNFRRLIDAYKTSACQPEAGVTRLCFNYVVGYEDLNDETRLAGLSKAASRHGIFFVCNTPFAHQSIGMSEKLAALARNYSPLQHSTFVGGQCQMGAGSSVTVDYDGTMFRCPYISGRGDGKFQEMRPGEIHAVIAHYLTNRQYACVMRKTPRC